MALVVYWQDIICFSIVGGAVLWSLYILWRKEGGGRWEGKSLYESLVVLRPDSSGYTGGGGGGGVPRGHVSSSQLWTSCWRGLHPAWLLGIRMVSFFVLAGFMSWDVVDWGGSIFFYYTEWTFSLVMMYFAIGSVVSAHGCWLFYKEKSLSENVETCEAIGDVEESTSITTFKIFRKKGFNKGNIKLESHYYQEQALQRAGFWGYLLQVTYQTCAGAVILTDIVFWCVIVPFLSISRLRLNLLMGCMHTLNLVFLLLDTSINRLPFPWFRLAYFVLWSSAYVIFLWIIHLCGFTWWPYPFLELSTPWAPLWYFILAAFHVACYGLYALVVRMKDSILSELFPHSYVTTC